MLESLLGSAVPAAGAPDQTRAPITARDLTEVADIMGPSLSPDGERVVFRVSRPSISANDTRLDWFVAEVGGGTPVHAGSAGAVRHDGAGRSEEHTSELQSLLRTSYAVFCLKKKKTDVHTEELIQ